MAPSLPPIPPEFSSELEPQPLLDNRTDAEILSSLTTFRPVTSERNIWAFWDTGLYSMPPWSARNVTGWVRLCGPSWTIRVLDNIPDSPNYALNYLPSESLPKCFVNRTMEGAHKGQHAADMVRTATILHHGGAYIDVGSLMIRHIERICWDVLEDEQRPERVCVPLMYRTMMMNHFVAARKGDPFIEAWHNLFIHLWKDRTTATGLISHPLLAPALSAMDPNLMEESGMAIPLKVDMNTMFEYVTQVLCWLRLCQIDYPDLDPSTCFSPATYWRDHIMTLQNIQEMHSIERDLGFERGGQPAVDVLKTRVNDPDRERVRYAQEVVFRALAQSSFQKVLRGKNLTVDPTLGALWDADEEGDADCREGTFAQVLRDGALRYRQTRAEVELQEKGAVEGATKGLWEV